MVQFHRGLRQGLAKDEALRQAMRGVAAKKEWAHLYHWSAFLLIGDPENRLLGKK